MALLFREAVDLAAEVVDVRDVRGMTSVVQEDIALFMVVRVEASSPNLFAQAGFVQLK